MFSDFIHNPNSMTIIIIITTTTYFYYYSLKYFYTLVKWL